MEAIKEEFFLSVVELVTEFGAVIFEDVARAEFQRTVGEVKIVSSSFEAWKGEGAERKGRFVINFSRWSKHWLKGTVEMDALQGFKLELGNENNVMGYVMFETTLCFRKRVVLPLHRRVVRVGEIRVLFLQDTVAAGKLQEGCTRLPSAYLYRRLFDRAETTGEISGEGGLR